jgi:hypothetical protein
MNKACTALLFASALPAISVSATAGVWTELGDARTRSDFEMAVAAGLLDNITTQGPPSWAGILEQLPDESRVANSPDDVREAAGRLGVQGRSDLDSHKPHISVSFDVTNDPAVIRGYDALGRSQVQGQATFDYLAASTAVHLSVGAQKSRGTDRQNLVFDGSYIAERIGGIVVYTGYKEHWWGPGWISALSLSNNARPMPQVGFTRVHSQQSDSWWLSWLGPWQIEGFVGLLDGPRQARDTAYIAVHFAFSPFPGFEIGLSRTTEMCGTGHSCEPLVDYFTFSNDPSHVNRTNEQGSIELRYTGIALSRPYAVYVQFMNEDSNPIVHSSTSKLFGGSVWFPYDGLTGRLTLEYANSIATNDIWGGPVQHGAAYNNYDYVDGMRYRGRTLGFSLDSDSVLYSAQASVIDPGRRTWTLTYHRALVSNPLNTSGNVVTASPVRFNAVEARVAVPLQWGDYVAQIETAVRWQDDQPRPDRGSQVAAELALKLGL